MSAAATATATTVICCSGQFDCFEDWNSMWNASKQTWTSYIDKAQIQIPKRFYAPIVNVNFVSVLELRFEIGIFVFSLRAFALSHSCSHSFSSLIFLLNAFVCVCAMYMWYFFVFIHFFCHKNGNACCESDDDLPNSCARLSIVSTYFIYVDCSCNWKRINLLWLLNELYKVEPCEMQ